MEEIKKDAGADEHAGVNQGGNQGGNQEAAGNGSVHAASPEAQKIELDLSSTSVETIEVFVEEASDPDIFHEILRKNRNRIDVIRVLLNNPNTPEDVRREAAMILSLPVPTANALAEERRRQAENKALDIQRERLVKRIQKFSIAEKIKLALKGGGEARGLLLKDSNKLVVLSVLENPRITDGEVEQIARSRSVMEEAIRKIAKNNEWLKNYKVVYALATNPKTPPALAMRFLPSLNKKDLGLLEKNKNVPEAVRSMAKRLTHTQKH